jgi:hypothetical protein
VVRGLGPGGNFCSCPDYATSELGTCKHLEFTLAKLLKKRGARTAFARGYQPTFSELYLRNEGTRRIHFRAGTDCPPAVRKAADGLFDTERNGLLSEEGMLSTLAFKRSLSAGILDGGSGEISLGGSRLNRFMKEVESVTGNIGEGEAVTPAEEMKSVVTMDGVESAEATGVDASVGAGAGARDGRSQPRRSTPVPTHGRPWRRLAHSLLPRCRPPAIRTPRRIRGSSAIQTQARKTSECRCRHRKLRDNLPVSFPRSRKVCAAGLCDRRLEWERSFQPPKYSGFPVVQVSPQSWPPPSTVSVSPVTNLPERAARYTLASAMSHGEPARIIGFERG